MTKWQKTKREFRYFMAARAFKRMVEWLPDEIHTKLAPEISALAWAMLKTHDKGKP